MSLRMKLVEFTVLKRDIDAVLLCLGRRSYMQLDLPPKTDASAEPRGDAALLERLVSAANYLSVNLDGGGSLGGASLPGDEERTRAARIIDEAERIKGGLDGIAKRRAGLDQASSEIAAFMKLGLPAKELELLTFIHIAVGKLPPEKVSGVQTELGDRAIILPLGDEGRVIALSSKKGRFALETSLKAAGFTAQGAPGDGEAEPEDIVRRLWGEIGATETRADELERGKALLAASSAAEAPALARSLRASAMVEDAKSRLISTEAAFFFRGWVARNRLPAMASELEAITEGRIAARSFDPEELPSVASGEEKVPVAMKHGAFVSSFKGMVLSYGTPGRRVTGPSIRRPSWQSGSSSSSPSCSETRAREPSSSSRESSSPSRGRGSS
jgi:V/A-type H+/Na+-transporting ATPase subunit I